MGCKCFARCEADCVCDHDWTPPAVIALRDEVERLRAELAAVRRVLNHAVAMAMDCDPELPHYLDRAEEHIDAARKGEETQ